MDRKIAATMGHYRATTLMASFTEQRISFEWVPLSGPKKEGMLLLKDEEANRAELTRRAVSFIHVLDD